MLEKNVLFLVTGMTPSIITETIWALACDPDLDESTRWIPDEVQVLSTEHGLDQIRSRLLNDKVFAQFKKDYPLLADVKFDESSLYSIKDEQGNALADLRTPEDNECAADMINEHIRQLAQSNNTVLHVSIAGGRKTMGFYAGYALSLHGRAQDRMSHVLVDQSYENVPDFFYPTPNAFYVKDRDNRAWDASKAQVWLAEIPFVRMKDAIKERHSIKDDSFMSTVHKINEASNDVKISIDVMGRTVRINDKYVIDDLPPREFAVLWWFADLRRNNKPGIITPTGNMNSKNLAAEQVKYIAELGQQFVKYYAEFKDLTERNVDIDKGFLNEIRSNLKKNLEAHLGIEISAKLAIVQSGRGKPFYLNVPQDAIEIIN